MYLDIETNSGGDITVVGLYGNGKVRSLIRGETLTQRQLGGELAQYDLLVTFCGTSFDVPMLRAHFPRLLMDQPHIDLCCLARNVGLRGGLKAIETMVGIERRADLLGLNGRDAVRLWNRWRHSRDETARERLLAYNEADCVNLQPLADLLYCRLVRQYHPSNE
ncbi:MAG: ribonuclease H-like domain-containing protein [Nitrospiraceae bacterium]